ncbi:MAG: helix-turn-helix domain-containing protein [Proteiniphilum sp.]
MSVYEKLGDYYLRHYLYQRAIDYHKLYFEEAQLSSDTFHIIHALNNLAFDFAQRREYNESAEYYFMALIQANKSGIETQEQTEIANTLNGLGEIYLDVNQADEAMNYFRKALQSDNQNQDPNILAITLQNIGTAYEYDKQYDSAYVFYQKSLEYHIKSNSISGLNNCFWHIGNLYMTEGEYEKALVYFERAYRSFLPTSDRLDWINVTLSLGELNIKMGNYLKAETYLEDARRISDELNLKDCLGRSYLLLSELHKKQGKTALALEERSLSDVHTNVFVKEKKTHQIMMHRLNYEKEMDKKEMNILTGLHQTREEKTKKVLFVTFLIIVILILNILILIQNIRIRRQKGLISLQLEKIKSGYYKIISEEVKTPASIIIGLIERLKKNLQNKSNDCAIELDMLSRQSENLFLLTNEITSLDNLQKDSKCGKVINGNIISYLRYFYESFTPLAETKKIDYVFHSNVSEIYMDYKPEYLRMVMHSLLYASFKLCTEYNHIEVSINCDSKKNNYTIKISYSGRDTGGNDLQYVVHPFFQESDSKTTNLGSGIGLTITKQLVEKMKGTISVKSDKFNGTIFTVNLPIHHGRTSQKGEPVAIRSKQTADSNHLHIPDYSRSQTENNDRPIVLIAEENRDMSYYLASVLKDKYILLTERNGEDAIKTAQEKIPDLVISDATLPLLDGFQLCKKLKNSLITNHIPVILLTLNQTKEERIKGIEYGADAFLSKPVYEEELRVVMDQLLFTRKQLREKYSPFLRINDNREEKTTVSNNVDLEFLQRVTSQIYKELTNTENIIEKISSEVCLSTSQLNRKIKAITGMTTSNYILKTRLNRAKKLLTLSQKPIGDIATECGFNDFAYFSRSFKKEFGMTPTTCQRIPQSAS